MASRFGPAQPRGTVWKGAGAWVMLSQARQEKRSRTVWITVQLRGTTSSVSVTSSPIFDRRVSAAARAGARARHHDAHARQVGREGLARRLPTFRRRGHRRLGGDLLGREGVGSRRSFEFLELQLVLVDEALRALGTLAIERAGELGDLEPEMGNQRRVTRQPGLHGDSLGLGAIGCGLGFIGALGGLIGSGLGGRESRAQRLNVDDLWLGALCHEESGS